MKAIGNRYIRLFAATAMLALGLTSSGCRVELDSVYVLPLDTAPTERDWERSLGMRMTASGGRTSLPGDADVDEDAVHAATASCHHGSEAPDVNVEVKGFYTNKKLYLRLVWTDPTPDLGPLWSWTGSGWRAAEDREDGLGLIWLPAEGFSCVNTCHLNDWRVAGVQAFADYAMGSPEGIGDMDFWVWKSGRGRVGGMAEDMRLTNKGMVSDGEGELFELNSTRGRAGAGAVFAPGDRPFTAPEVEPGVTAMGRSALGGADNWSGRTEVAGIGSHADGLWTVTLTRDLAGSEAEDVRIEPGGIYKVGISLLDGVVRDHNAVHDPVRLVLIERSE